MSTELSQVVVAAVSVIVTVCVASVKHMHEKSKELADAVLIQNNKICDLERKLAVAEYRLSQLQAK